MDIEAWIVEYERSIKTLPDLLHEITSGAITSEMLLKNSREKVADLLVKRVAVLGVADIGQLRRIHANDIRLAAMAPQMIHCLGVDVVRFMLSDFIPQPV